MELDPTTTNDQDDNERLVRYLKCQLRSKNEQVNGFVNMVMKRIKEGCSVYHVVFVFQHNTPIGLMKCELNNVYRAILTRYDRDPRKSDNAEKPWFFFWPDVPVSAAEQHALNEGGDNGGDYVDRIHYHAVVVIPLIDKGDVGKERLRDLLTSMVGVIWTST